MFKFCAIPCTNRNCEREVRERPIRDQEGGRTETKDKNVRGGFPKTGAGQQKKTWAGYIELRHFINPYAPLACGHFAASSQKDFGRRGYTIASMQNLSGRF